MLMNFRDWISYRLGSSLVSARPIALSGADDGAPEAVLMMEKLAKPGEVLEENKKIGELEEMLKERAEELQVIESFQSCILNKVKETDDELEAIKGVIIEELIDVTRDESTISVKKMGHLDEEVFVRACKLKGVKGDLELEAAFFSRNGKMRSANYIGILLGLPSLMARQRKILWMMRNLLL